MDGWFEFNVETDRCLVRLTMGGFFDAERVEQMRVAFIDALARLGCAPNQHLTLCDITAMNIQTQDMVSKFSGLVGSPEVRSRRLAFVTSSTLARVQARRLTDRPGVEFFKDTADAIDWLEDPRSDLP